MDVTDYPRQIFAARVEPPAFDEALGVQEPTLEHRSDVVTVRRVKSGELGDAHIGHVKGFDLWTYPTTLQGLD